MNNSKLILTVLILSCFASVTLAQYAAAGSCGSITHCTSCEQYGTNTSTLRCAQCNTGYYLDQLTATWTCTACLTGSATCDQLYSSTRYSYTCTDTTKYAADPVCQADNSASNGCIACATQDAHASTCNGNYITACAAGYFISLDQSSCIACNASTSTCTAGTTLSCKTGNLHINGVDAQNQEDYCVACDSTKATCDGSMTLVVKDTFFCQLIQAKGTFDCSACPTNGVCSLSSKGVYYIDDHPLDSTHDVQC